MSTRVTMSERRFQPGPSAERRAADAAPGRARPWASPRYYACVAVLAVSAAAMQSVARFLDGYFRKEPLPLKTSLNAFDTRKLAPVYALHPVLPPAIDHETLETLGTEEYLQIILVDQSKPRDDRTAVAHLFVTYYTGRPDMVPHDPNECMQAGGFGLDGAPQYRDVVVPDVDAPRDRIPVCAVSFTPPRSRKLSLAATERGPTVLYFFHTNGHFATTRNEVRLSQANLFNRYAYYSKIELRFSDYSFQRNADREESLAAAEPLLRKIVPILLEDHFQDWKKLTTGGTPVAGGAPI